MDAVWLCILRSYQNPRRSFTPEIWLRLRRAVFLSVLCVQLIPFRWLWSSCLGLRLCRAVIFCLDFFSYFSLRHSAASARKIRFSRSDGASAIDSGIMIKNLWILRKCLKIKIICDFVDLQSRSSHGTGTVFRHPVKRCPQ
jgi:hypothetical protein